MCDQVNTGVVKAGAGAEAEAGGGGGSGGGGGGGNFFFPSRNVPAHEMSVVINALYSNEEILLIEVVPIGWDAWHKIRR